MEKMLDIWIKYDDTCLPREAEKVLNDFKDKYEHYLNNDNPLSKYWPDFSIPDGDEAITILTEIRRKYPNEINVDCIWMWLSYEEHEADNFPAFIPYFDKHYCEEYDDVDYIYDECPVCYSRGNFIESRLWDNKSYGNVKLVAPSRYLKKSRDIYSVMTINSGDGVDLISIPLRDKLVEIGYKEASFKGVSNKRGNTLAYEFVEDTVLPSGTITSERFRETQPCPTCGRIDYGMDENKNELEYKPYSIAKDDIKLLGDISKTQDCFYEFPLIIVSPRLRKDILKLCPEAEFEPVFIKP